MYAGTVQINPAPQQGKYDEQPFYMRSWRLYLRIEKVTIVSMMERFLQTGPGQEVNFKREGRGLAAVRCVQCGPQSSQIKERES
jgi:hypothetical protein